MARRVVRVKTVAFKVEEELAELLDKIHNKSAFIRNAVVKHLGVACPMCNGNGFVPRGLHEHFESLVSERSVRPCESCREEQTFSPVLDESEAFDRARLEQFFLGGPFYCVRCYRAAPACDQCGWRVAPDHLLAHLRRTHLPQRPDG